MVEGNPVVWVKKTPMLTGWYYESDPDFIKKYPQAEHDPEFMLEPHGDRPFKEMYRRPLYEGAGLTTVRSTEDAQRLLDHLLSLRYSESVVKISESPSEQLPEQGSFFVAPQPHIKANLEAISSKGIGSDDEASTGSFWSFDQDEMS